MPILNGLVYCNNGKRIYRCPINIIYKSPRNNKTVTVPSGYLSDGATGGIDLYSDAWYIHDWMCGNYKGYGPEPRESTWDDGSLISNLQASLALYDILVEEKRRVTAIFWFIATFLFGGKKAKRNGIFKV